jgi:hypothetical protein
MLQMMGMTEINKDDLSFYLRPELNAFLKSHSFINNQGSADALLPSIKRRAENGFN